VCPIQTAGARESEFTAPAHVSLACLCMHADFARGTNKRHPVFSRPRRGFLHARTRTHWVTRHVTFFHGKRSQEFYNPDSAHPSETSAPGRPQHTSASLVSQITTRRRARAFVCHLVLPCATVVVHARPGPLLFLFERTHNYSVDNQGFVPWQLRHLGRSKVRSASLLRVLSDSKISWALGSQGF